MTSQPLCYAPFRNIRLNTLNAGQVLMRPCCMYQDFNTAATNVQEYLDSDFLKNAQTKMFASVLPKECYACQSQENLGQKSARQYMLEFFGSHEGGIAQLEAETSNVCNLRCWMCNEDNSSAIAAERKALGWISQYSEVDNTQLTIDTINRVDSLTRVTFIGGEFFLSKRNIEVLELIAKKQIGVRVVTNATVLLPKHIEILKQIPDLGIQVSMEGIEDCYEFMRWPGVWANTSSNILQLKTQLPHADININCVVQPLNIHRVIEMLAWINPIMIPTRLVNLGHPFWLTWPVFTQQEQQTVVDLLQNQLSHAVLTRQQKETLQGFVKTIINTKPDAQLRQEFVERMTALLRHRKIPKSKVMLQLVHCPELAKLIT